MRPSWITTAAWISPWREVPQPKYVPSLYCGFGGAGGAGTDVAGTGSATAAGNSAARAGNDGVGAAISGSTVTAGVAAARLCSTSPRRIRVSLDRRRGRCVGPPGAGEGTTCGTMPSAVEGLASTAVGDEAEGAGIAGRRADACTANRSAADFVRRYPAVYTASTAAEPNATRPFATFLWEPLSDTALHYSGERWSSLPLPQFCLRTRDLVPILLFNLVRLGGTTQNRPQPTRSRHVRESRSCRIWRCDRRASSA